MWWRPVACSAILAIASLKHSTTLLSTKLSLPVLLKHPGVQTLPTVQGISGTIAALEDTSALALHTEYHKCIKIINLKKPQHWKAIESSYPSATTSRRDLVGATKVSPDDCSFCSLNQLAFLSTRCQCLSRQVLHIALKKETMKMYTYFCSNMQLLLMFILTPYAI